jgi:HAD superfamily hydrolase (TIGR01549 family)
MVDELSILEKKAIIYDMDNTLVATDNYVLKHIKETTQKLGIDIAEETIAKFQKLNLQFEDLFASLFGENAEHVLLKYRETAPEKPFFAVPGAVEFVKYLQSMDKLQGIVTNRTRMAEMRLSQAGFPKFSFIFSPPSSELKKPHPEAYNPALEWLRSKKIDQSDIMTIGDHIHDYLSAKSAGIEFYAVLTGKTEKQQFIDAGLDERYIFNDLKELKEAYK